MQRRSGWLGVGVASLVGVVLLWAAYQQWLDVSRAVSRWSGFLVSLFLLGVGVAAGSAFIFSGVRPENGTSRLLVAATPFGVLVLYFWYWLTGWPTLDMPSSLARFLVSEPIILAPPAVVGVAIGLVVWNHTTTQDADSNS